MNDQQRPLPFEEVVGQFPAFVLGLTFGLLRALLTETDVFLLLVWGVLLALLTTPLVGAVGALGLYLLFRSWLAGVGVVCRHLSLLASVIREKEISVQMDERPQPVAPAPLPSIPEPIPMWTPTDES